MKGTEWYWKHSNARNTAARARLPTRLGHVGKTGQYGPVAEGNFTNNNHNAAETDSEQLFNLNMLG